MTFPATLKWVLLALLGIAVAAAVAIAASNLASRQIGLASEPISAGDALAPATSAKGSSHNKTEREAEPPATTTTAPGAETTAPEATTPPAETQPPPERDDSHGGGGHGGDSGGGGGHGADD